MDKLTLIERKALLTVLSLDTNEDDIMEIMGDYDYGEEYVRAFFSAIEKLKV